MSLTVDEAQQKRTDERPRWETVRDAPIGFLAALQFLTVVPPLIRRPFTPAELGRAVGWLALVGVLLGGVLVGVDSVLGLWFPRGAAAALLLATWVLATGALHLDGFLDSCDGLLGGQTPEARLRIMRDERVGAFAVIGGVLLLLLKYACLVSLTDRTVGLIVAPTLGRWAMTLAVVAFPYARSEGLGRAMKDHAGRPQIVLATLTALATVALMASRGASAPGAALAGTVIATVLFAVFVLRRLPGFTGDLYGALCELVETMTLLVFVAGERP